MDGSWTCDPAALVRVGRIVPRTEAEGPGTRYAVWVQGCSLRCHGCFNPHLWARDGGRLLPVRRVVEGALGSGAEGITLLGGEPFDQAGPLGAVAALVRDRGLSVMTFSGYTRSRLEARARTEQDVAALLRHTDLLVDGPYLAARPDRDRAWVGSTNQRFHHLTDRYRSLPDDMVGIPDRLEVRVGADGAIQVNGWASAAQLELLLDHPVARGAERQPPEDEQHLGGIRA